MLFCDLSAPPRVSLRRSGSAQMEPMDTKPRSTSLFNPLDMQPEDVEQFAAAAEGQPAEMESEEPQDVQVLPPRPLASAAAPGARVAAPTLARRPTPPVPCAQRASCASDLVGKEVWDLLAVEGLSEGTPAGRSSQSGAPAQLANLGSLGGYKRSRVAASLSSVSKPRPSLPRSLSRGA